MEDDVYQRLLGFALNYVSIRPRSESEIKTYLQKKIQRWHIADAYLVPVLTRMKELGYINDASFAEAFIHSGNKSRPKGSFRVKMELQRKGVNPETIAKALELVQADEGTNDTDLARIAAIKRLRSLKRHDIKGQISKLTGFLARRGFTHTVISSIIDEMFPKGLQ